jgi:hypothetical protein
LHNHPVREIIVNSGRNIVNTEKEGDAIIFTKKQSDVSVHWGELLWKKGGAL